MAEQERVFVVIDPAAESQPALARGVITAGLREPHAELLLHVALDGSAVDTRADNAYLYRDRAWFEALFAPVEAAGLDYRCQVTWTSEWAEAILRAARRFQADLLLLPLAPRAGSRRALLSEGMWQVLRNAHCPVLMARPEAKPRRAVVLAALKAQSGDPRYVELNRKIAGRARWMAERYGAALHVVNAYRDQDDYPDRARLLELAGVPNEQVHVEDGPPDRVIAQVAATVGADIVVVGTLARQGLAAVMRGNTSERVIAALPQDVMTLN
ncbi:MAG TPA: universal stress protein [Gammaproteobacteria bacterium]